MRENQPRQIMNASHAPNNHQPCTSTAREQPLPVNTKIIIRHPPWCLCHTHKIASHCHNRSAEQQDTSQATQSMGSAGASLLTESNYPTAALIAHFASEPLCTAPSNKKKHHSRCQQTADESCPISHTTQTQQQNTNPPTQPKAVFIYVSTGCHWHNPAPLKTSHQLCMGCTIIIFMQDKAAAAQQPACHHIYTTNSPTTR